MLPTPAKGKEIFAADKRENNDKAVQDDVKFLMDHLESNQEFSVDHLRSLYVSLLSGLGNGEDGESLDVETMIDEAIANIDTNGDGMIDVLEMESVHMPHETGEFVFDDVVACTSTPDEQDEECITANNIVEFLNMFYGGHKVVSDELAEHIVELSGDDQCFTRSEFEDAFAGVSDVDEISAGVMSHGYSFETSLVIPTVALAVAVWSMVM